jgi:hypothetical protein
VRGLYDQAKDRESAYEMLQGRAEKAASAAAEAEQAAAAAKAAPNPAPTRQPAPPRASNRQGMGEAFAKSMLRTIGNQVAREIMRGVLGSLKRR